MPKKEEIIGDAGLYSMMSILTQIVTLAAAILTRRFLGPVQTGVWALLQIILVYAGYLTLGVTAAVSREIPFYQGQGNHQKVEEIKNSVYSFSTLTALLVSVGCVGYALVLRGQLRPELFWGLVGVSVLVMLQRYNNLNIAFLRGYKLFTLASKQMILSAVVNAVLVVLLSYKFEVYGFMVAMSLSFGFNILYVKFHYAFRFKWHFDLSKIWALIRYGFPLSVITMVSSFFLTIDKLMIAKILGIESLGLYSVALLAFTYLYNLPNSIGIVLIPNFHQKFGETEKAESLKNYLEKSSHAFQTIMPLMIASGWFLVPYFARLALPDFEGSITPMKYLITSVFWAALIDPYSYFLVVIRKQILLLPIIAGACLLAFLANFFALTHGFGILGVGVVTTLVFFCNFTATYFFACSYLYPPAVTWRRYILSLLRFFLMLSVMVLLNRFFPRSEYSLAATVAQFFIFAAVYSPFLYRLNKDLEILSTLKRKFFKRSAPEEETAEAQ